MGDAIHKMKPSTAFTICLLTMIIILPVAFAIKSPAPIKVSEYATTFDLIGGKGLDTVTSDLDKDGYNEMTGIDTDNDGIINIFLFDNDKCCGAELTYINTDADDDIEVITLDVNKDGLPDAWDLNADGVFDAFDMNRDTIPDAIDDDGDGVIDRRDLDGDFMYDTPLDQARDHSGSSGGYSLLLLVILLIIGYYGYKMYSKKSAPPSPNAKKEPAKASGAPGSGHSKTIQIVCLIFNLFLPGVGYFFLGDVLRKKAFIVTIITLIGVFVLSGTIQALLLIIIWIYCLVNVGRSLIRGA